MSDITVHMQNLGKAYRLYRRQGDKVLDAFGINRWLFWRKNYYQEFWALRDISINIRVGERLGIIGRNGAGKSTLLKILCGNVVPTEGSYQVNGTVQALLELGTGFHPEFTGRQNIRASLALQGFTPAQIAEKEAEIVDFAELDQFIDQPIKTYSAGMNARLAFSTATAVEPEILIIDEVLGAGDAYFAGKCVERMRKLTQDSGITVLFVSHDLGSVQRLCDRVIWIDRGRLRRDGKSLEVVKDYTQMVRRDEEVRLRARDLRVSRKDVLSLKKNDDVYDKLLFHLRVDGASHPSGIHRIYSIVLSLGNEEIGRIDVGGPMDNSSEHLHYLIDNPGYMDWGKSKMDAIGRYREYGDFRGKYNHAPFEFAIPKTLGQEIGDRNLRLKIRALANDSDRIVVEVFNRELYMGVGVLRTGSHDEQFFEIPGEIIQRFRNGTNYENVECMADTSRKSREKLDNLSPIDNYGSGRARIIAVRMVNSSGEDKRIFEVGEALDVVLEYEAYEELNNPVFVFCAYLPDGRCASQWITGSEEIGHPRVQGTGKVTFRINRLLMGKGAYFASAAIFKNLRTDGLEPESYHVKDRCIHFQILQRHDAVYDCGLTMQPFTAELSHG
jgi:lipopolysaccharide transport system ATP-binding protein